MVTGALLDASLWGKLSWPLGEPVRTCWFSVSPTFPRVRLVRSSRSEYNSTTVNVSRDVVRCIMRLSEGTSWQLLTPFWCAGSANNSPGPADPFDTRYQVVAYRVLLPGFSPTQQADEPMGACGEKFNNSTKET